MTLGCASSPMSIMRAAPTGALDAVVVPREYSSISTRYGWPPIVTGIGTWGMLTSGQVRWLTTRTCGLATRFWMSLVSKIQMPDGLARSAA